MITRCFPFLLRLIRPWLPTGNAESHELSANSTTYLTITSCQRFNAYLERSGLDYLIEQMQTSNARR